MLRRFAAGLLLASSIGLAGAADLAAPPAADSDYHSYANLAQFRLTHAELAIGLDWDDRQVLGTAALEFKRLDPAATQIVLDTKDLDVLFVTQRTTDIVGAIEKPEPIWVNRPFHLGKADPVIGRPLIVELPAAKEKTVVIKIEYKSASPARGLKWQAPKRYERKPPNFLYSLSAPISARSWFPVQDTPRVRATYKIHVHTADESLALMSAVNDPKARRDGDFWFEMKERIPAAALSLAVGDLEYRATGPRTGVYAQRGLAKSAAKQFGDAEAMLEMMEKLLGAYPWERFDIVVPPGSFPIAVNVSPRLAFVSPTAIAGDNKPSAALSRAVAASWASADIGITAWTDRWIGEALSGYLQGRITAALYGDNQAAIDQFGEWRELRAALAAGGPQAGVLAADLRGEEYDDIFDTIARDKGRLFFGYLENRFGRERFDYFLRAYFDQFAGHLITTEQFLAYLGQNLLDRYPGLVSAPEARSWVYDPGLPAGALLPAEDAFAPLDQARSAWLGGKLTAPKLGAQGWSTPQWRYFLDGIPAGSGAARLAELDKAYSLSAALNAEVASSWFVLVIREVDTPAFPQLEQYLQGVGRLQLIEPLYRQLEQTPAGAAAAKRVYAKARPGYHPFVAARIDAIVSSSEPEGDNDD